MKRIAIIQARMTSSRLPGKVLASLAGRPMLAQQLARVKRMSSIDDIVVATTINADDDPVVALCRELHVGCYRGDEHDVLSRYAEAAREAAADVVVRITADCPLLDPEVSDRVVDALDSDADYASNAVPRTFPRGLDTEALHRDVLERMHRMARSESAREHVTTFIRHERPELFELRNVEDEEDNSDLSWTVDTEEDFARVSALYEELGLGEAHRPYREILAHVRAKR
jgi:spore coat polysaccharide biosynthesis protein SpsF